MKEFYNTNMFSKAFSLENFEFICRLCGKESKNLTKLNIRKTKQKNIKATIEKYIGIKISSGDGFPDGLCRPCLSKIEEVKNFVQTSLKMQESLKRLITENPRPCDFIEITIKEEPLQNNDLDETISQTALLEQESTFEEADSGSHQASDKLTSGSVYNTPEFINLPLAEESVQNRQQKSPSPKGSATDDKEEDPLKNEKKKNILASVRIFKKAKDKLVTQKFYKCPKCTKVYKSKESLKSHRRRVHNQTMEKCPKCEKIMSSKYLWKRHMLIHSGVKKYQCSECDRSYSSNNSLRIHKTTHIPLEQRCKYECDICGKRFALKHNVKAHLKLHTGMDGFVCDQCGNSYKTKGNLQTHYRTHTGEKPYECNICGKKYSTSKPLQVHLRTHTGAKPFACTVCDKTFSSPFVLKRHLLIHSGTKPYPCRYCSKSFRDHGKRKVHERIHTGERPYKCSLCSSAFSESGNLRKHSRQVHGREPNEEPLPSRDELVEGSSEDIMAPAVESEEYPSPFLEHSVFPAASLMNETAT